MPTLTTPTDRADRYREAAAQRIRQLAPGALTVPEHADVAILNCGHDRASTGEGAYVEVRVWIPAGAVASTHVEH